MPNEKLVKIKRKRHSRSGEEIIIMKNLKKLTALAGICAVTAVSLAACGQSGTTTETKADTNAAQTEAGSQAAESTADSAKDTQAASEASADLSGSITMAGSTSMEKLANAVAEAFMEKYPNVTVNAEFTGSSAGIESLLSGSVDIGNSSRALEDSEKQNGAVAIDGIAVVVNPDTKVENLTKEQLAQIYTGEITDWADVDGDSAPIVVIGREAGSGTRGAFEELLDVADKCTYASELDSTGAVMAKVASTPGSIGYVSLDVLDDTVKALKLEGVEPTAENIKAGNYFLSRPFVMATKGEISEQSEPVQALFDYLSSAEGKDLISSVGLITVD